MKRIYIFCSVLLGFLLGSCKDYDDSAIQDKLNDFKERIAVLQEKRTSSTKIFPNWDI